MEINNEPRRISFSTQKGGVGKTTFTILFANYLHNLKNYNVLVIDCDFPQHSISASRKRELEKIQANGQLKLLAYNHFRRSGKKAFDIINSSPETAIETLEANLDNTGENYDYVFFDLPGTVNSHGVINTLSQMDYVFTPISADRIALESSLSFALTFKEKIVDNSNYRVKDLQLFWNQVDKREKTGIYLEYEEIIRKLNIKVLNTVIPASLKFKKEIENTTNTFFRSTILPPDKRITKSVNVGQLIEEILTTIIP